MCIHEPEQSPQLKKLANAMKAHGLIAITLVNTRTERAFTMFANPNNHACVHRCVHDLRSWHRGTTMSDQTFFRLRDSGMDHNALDKLWNDIPGRDVPDSLDLEETDVEAVYRRCEANGYVHAEVGDKVAA